MWPIIIMPILQETAVKQFEWRSPRVRLVSSVFKICNPRLLILISVLFLTHHAALLTRSGPFHEIVVKLDSINVIY